MINISEKKYSCLKDALADIDRDHEGEIIIDLNGEHLHERVIVNVPNVTIRNGTIEADKGGYEMLSDGYKRGTFRTWTVFVSAPNVTFDHVSVINSNGYKNGQAIALMIDGDDFRAYDSVISSYQDTLFIAPLPEQEYEPRGFVGPLQNTERVWRRARFERCLIEGSVDFIFGGGEGYFRDSEIRSRDIHGKINGYVSAPSTPQDRKYGFIYDHCNFTSEEGMENSVYLARPWRDYAKNLIVDCHLGSHIRPEGYHDWEKERARETTEFKEWNNSSDGPTERVSWMKEVNNEDLHYIDSLRKEERG